jgi:hypothetical protein
LAASLARTPEVTENTRRLVETLEADIALDVPGAD